MIRVSIQKNRLDRMGHETLVGGRVMKAARDAGIPVEGVFALRGVSHGQLIYHNEDGLDGAEHVVTWREDNADTDKAFTRVGTVDGVSTYRSGRHLVALANAEDDDDL